MRKIFSVSDLEIIAMKIRCATNAFSRWTLRWNKKFWSVFFFDLTVVSRGNSFFFSFLSPVFISFSAIFARSRDGHSVLLLAGFTVSFIFIISFDKHVALNPRLQFFFAIVQWFVIEIFVGRGKFSAIFTILHDQERRNDVKSPWNWYHFESTLQPASQSFLFVSNHSSLKAQ